MFQITNALHSVQKHLLTTHCN